MPESVYIYCMYGGVVSGGFRMVLYGLEKPPGKNPGQVDVPTKMQINEVNLDFVCLTYN